MRTDINPASLARDIADLDAAPPAVLDVLAAIGAARSTADEAPDVAGKVLTATAKEVPELIRELAAYRANIAVLPEARGEVADLLERRLARELVAAGPEILAALGEHFTAPADRLEAAVAQLPERLDPEMLVRAGSATVAAYEAALNAAAEVNALVRLRDHLAILGVRASGPMHEEKATRYVDFADRDAFEQSRFVDKAGGHLGRWPSLLRLPGVRGLWWPTLEEQTAAIARLVAEAQPAKGKVG